MQTPIRYRKLPRRLDGPWALLRRFGSENMMQTSAALAFTTLMALVPLVTLVLSVADVIPYFDQLVARLDFLIQGSLLPSGASSTIAKSIGDFSHKAQQLTWAGIGVLAVSAFLLLHTIERAFNHVWRVKPRPWYARLRLYAFVMMVWPFALGAIAGGMSFAVTTSLGLFDEPAWIRRWAFKVLGYGLQALFFAFLYHSVPNAPVSKRAAAYGGTFATVAFAVMQRIFELFLVKSALLKSIYGAFAVFPVFLVWLNFSWAVVLFGGLIAAAATPRSKA